jgi:hypothetical protein
MMFIALDTVPVDTVFVSNMFLTQWHFFHVETTTTPIYGEDYLKHISGGKGLPPTGLKIFARVGRTGFGHPNNSNARSIGRSTC